MTARVRRSARIAAIVLVGCSVLGPAAVANAVPLTSAHVAAATVRHYKNCAAVHKQYSGGIARAGVNYNTIKHKNGTVTKTKLQGKVEHSTALYTANKKLDRDKDGVACEKA